MAASQIAVQGYTLRDHLKTPVDIAKTLARVKKIGYDAVQVSAFGPIDPHELARILKDNDLVVPVTHVGKDRMRDDTAKVIEEHKLWGATYTAIGGHSPKEDYTRAMWEDFAREYSAIAEKFRGSGITIGYHNHSHELAKIADAPGATPLQLLIDQCSKDVWFEIDTYWITQGGGDPAAWIDKVKGRIPCVHLKDMAVKQRGREQYMAEVGEGNLNWPRILEACRSAGVEWYIVEQDICYRDPFESIQISLDNLRTMGIT